MFKAGKNYYFSVLYFLIAVEILYSAELSMTKVLKPRGEVCGFCAGSLVCILVIGVSNNLAEEARELVASCNNFVFWLSVCLFDLILYIPSTIFQLCKDGSSWVEPVLS